jgi:hypothetical protein
MMDHPLDRKLSRSASEQMPKELLRAIREHRKSMEEAGDVRVHPDDEPRASAKHAADQRLWALLNYYDDRMW